MKPRTRSAKRSLQRFQKLYLLIACILAFCLLLATRMIPPASPALRTLTALPVPQPSEIYLPGPYEAAHVVSPVLGADTIDPKDIITYINNERMKTGASPLRSNTALTRAAQMRANVILKYQNFAHHDPYEHIQLDTVLPMVQYPFRYASENIGLGDNSAQGFVFGFMHSTSHRENLLNPSLQETGVAVVTGQMNGYWVNIAVQLFAIPATQEQYLGYKDEDIENYKQLLSDIDLQLAAVNERLQNSVSDDEYYESWKKLLMRQREILTLLYDTMLKRQPFVQNLISLIREYNKNWNNAPKS